MMNPVAALVAVSALSLAAGCGGGTSTTGDAGAHDAAGHDAPAHDHAASDGPSRDGGGFIHERILFLVDTSGAMVVLDASKARVQAVDQVIQEHKGDSNVQIAVIATNSSTSTFPAAGFTSAVDETAVDALLSQAANLGDYEGGLDAVAKLVHQDAMATAAATRAQTRYVVVYLGGSTPSPHCTAEATPCGSTTCPAQTYCAAGSCNMQFLLCTTPRAQWSTTFNPPVNPSYYPDLVAGADYNTSALIQQKVADIVALQSNDKIGSVEVNAVLVFDPSAAKNPLAAPFQLSRADSTQLLKQMAKTGGGTYIDLSATPKLPF